MCGARHGESKLLHHIVRVMFIGSYSTSKYRDEVVCVVGEISHFPMLRVTVIHTSDICLSYQSLHPGRNVLTACAFSESCYQATFSNTSMISSRTLGSVSFIDSGRALYSQFEGATSVALGSADSGGKSFQREKGISAIRYSGFRYDLCMNMYSYYGFWQKLYPKKIHCDGLT